MRVYGASRPEEPLHATDRPVTERSIILAAPAERLSLAASPESIESRSPLPPRFALAELPTVEAERRAPLPPSPGENEPPETVVHVSIGRIDVRAFQPPAPERRLSRSSGPRLTLANYLEQREERR